MTRTTSSPTPQILLVSGKWGFRAPEATTRDILWVLEQGYEIGRVGGLRDTILVEPRFDRDTMSAGKVWSLHDNGGEIQVALVNGPDGGVGIPVTAYGTPLDVGTIAYRLAYALRGYTIDWDLRLPELLDELAEALHGRPGGMAALTDDESALVARMAVAA